MRLGRPNCQAHVFRSLSIGGTSIGLAYRVARFAMERLADWALLVICYWTAVCYSFHASLGFTKKESTSRRTLRLFADRHGRTGRLIIGTTALAINCSIVRWLWAFTTTAAASSGPYERAAGNSPRDFAKTREVVHGSR